jgi:DNA primase catalytic core
VTASLQKLTAGRGYDYLIRQVAAMDAPGYGRAGLASYYAERGESPGVWVGSGMAGIDGLNAGDVVTQEQMQALFGTGHHPLATQLQPRLEGPDLQARDYQRVSRLGAPYPVFAGDVSSLRRAVAQRVAAHNEALGVPRDWPVTADERALIRTQVATELFHAEHGRDPLDARELSGTIARHSQQRTTAVAGYDLTFSPVKSVSALWAVADPKVAAQVELAHDQAIADALAFLERRALFTRTGHGGIQQVPVRGLVATAFTHRDSRAGDPDLHTHVAIANKVQTLDGRWLSIDGRVLYKANVSISETYNTALERHLHDRLGVTFTDRPNRDPRKRPTREIVGVDPDLNTRWSARRASIEARRDQLTSAFQAAHGRPPAPVEAIKLAQQATLETRPDKQEPRTLAEQRTLWRAQAVEVLGGPQRLEEMTKTALSPGRQQQQRVTTGWVQDAAERVTAAMMERRATWQDWHVRAEVLRMVRAANVPTGDVDEAVDRVVHEVLTRRSVAVTAGRVDEDRGIVEPALLRRGDGQSVYYLAGSQLFTSTAILEAEQRLVAAAGWDGGRAVTNTAVDLALLESTANGVTLNAGQASLVAAMATSGRRLQLAIAPAGSGKTTTMRALSRAWVDDGGTLVGLAPSAAAAAVLGDQIGTHADTHADTLAKLVWHIQHQDLPGWAERIDERTLVVIDEAGMADTLSLDTAVQFVLARGGSVRLVGDDQQLAAIGASGVLRDIQAVHGAVQLSELVRFADPGEAAASLALREGRTEALGYYLDRGRVHVGDQATTTEAVFDAWMADRGHGLDALMLAPTRELAADLNRRARDHRLTGLDNTSSTLTSVRTVRLADGNQAGVGETVISRSNDRRLRVSPTDWVKNGDRWTVLAIHDNGALQVQHARHRRTLTLPPEYVSRSVELGYAATVHSAQGVSVDTMHGLVTGQETRQQLYTMLTRGAAANHAYLQVVGDGDPHNLLYPNVLHPDTPTDLLEQILARDGANRSVTTQQRQAADPALRLGPATSRYLDALYTAAADHAGPGQVAALDAHAEQVVPGVTDAAAWPTLRAHLLLLHASGQDAVATLTAAAQARELTSAGDIAAVLDWRLDASGLRNAGPGPLPWTPAVPAALTQHPTWGPYLRQRAALIRDLADVVTDTSTAAARSGQQPPWAPAGTTVSPTLAASIDVWRAATGVDPTDQRPLGRPQLHQAAARYQQQLQHRLTGDRPAATDEWAPTLHQIAPAVTGDAFLPVLADHLAAMSRAGLSAPHHLNLAAAAGTLPDDHAAAALWWRIRAQLPATLTATLDASQPVHASWLTPLRDTLTPQTTAQFEHSRFWPAFVTAMDHAHARGWATDQLLHLVTTAADAATSAATSAEDHADVVLAATWRLSVLADPANDPTDDPTLEPPVDPDEDVPPQDLWHDAPPDRRSPETAHPISTADTVDTAVTGSDEPPTASSTPTAVPAEQEPEGALEPVAAENTATAMALEALRRDAMTMPELTDAEINTLLDRAIELDQAEVTEQRMVEVNQLALDFYRSQLAGSWTEQYLTDRLGPRVLTDARFTPGHAPDGWTNLVDTLRRRGVSDDELLATDLARRASTGRLIDRFRDRTVLPITHHHLLVGFVARRHPDRTDHSTAGPKYLNTGQTALFHKGSHLYGADHLTQAATPVLVEGPLDAIAVTLAGHGRYVGVSPLGTSLTHEQARQLGRHGVDPIVATDADLAGQVAAERDYWILTPWLLDPTHAHLPTGMDPAELAQLRGPYALRAALDQATPLADTLTAERHAHLPTHQALAGAARITAARPAQRWVQAARNITATATLADNGAFDRQLLARIRAWRTDPRAAADQAVHEVTEVRARMEAAAAQTPQQRWAVLADQLDRRITTQPDWFITAQILQLAHDQGHDVDALTRTAIQYRPLGNHPGQDLRYALVPYLDVPDPPWQGEPTRAPAARTDDEPVHAWSSSLDLDVRGQER